MNLLSMPNGKLHDIYQDEILQAGKLKSQVRFKYTQCLDFRLLEGKKRIKVILLNEKVHGGYSSSFRIDSRSFVNQRFKAFF